MDQKNLINKLRLIRTPNIGPITCQLLMRRYGSAAAALDAVPDLSARGGRPLKLATRQQIEREIEQADRLGASFICHGDEDYPACLLQFDDAPFVLTVKGHKSLLNKKGCALVGARNASINATRLAQSLAMEIGQAGYSIISGLARGIDTAAHHGSLDTGTLAVLACGIDEIYPPENTDLFAQIAEQGLLITETPFGTKPTPRLFPARNRIIASLSLGVCVIEAAFQSGSLITAREAADRGIDVMAVPGSPLDPRSQGTNRLIQDGAHLVQSAQDILSILDQKPALKQPDLPEFGTGQSPEASDMTPEEWAKTRQFLLENLAHDPIGVDELCRWCHVSAIDGQAILLELELAGDVQRHAGNRVSRVYQDSKCSCKSYIICAERPLLDKAKGCVK